MQYILDLLNKIKWDKKENLNDYSVAYFGRVLSKNRGIRINDIKSIEGNFMTVGEEESHIPLHRIR